MKLQESQLRRKLLASPQKRQESLPRKKLPALLLRRLQPRKLLEFRLNKPDLLERLS